MQSPRSAGAACIMSSHLSDERLGMMQAFARHMENWDPVCLLVLMVADSPEVHGGGKRMRHTQPKYGECYCGNVGSPSKYFMAAVCRIAVTAC